MFACADPLIVLPITEFVGITHDNVVSIASWIKLYTRNIVFIACSQVKPNESVIPFCLDKICIMISVHSHKIRHSILFVRERKTDNVSFQSCLRRIH